MLLATAAACSLVGCKKGPQPFADTLGRSFTYECKEKGGCTFARQDAPSNPKKTDVLLARKGRVLSVCDVPPGAKDAATPGCRAVTCETGDCPPDPNGARLACENGLCVAPQAEITTDDSILLCMADTQLGRGAKQSARLALAYSCGRPCVIPPSCRQP